MKTRYYAMIACAWLMAACTETLIDQSGSSGRQDDGLTFRLSTTEMGTEVVGLGATRTNGPMAAVKFGQCTPEGDNPYGLKVYRQPLPLVGIHRGAVKEGGAERAYTRAGTNEVVASNGSNFHDSLTIWGYTDAGVSLFDQIVLTKVRNWRNSVEWPYGQGNYMKFYAVAPSLESINMSATAGTYATAPTLRYTLPEEASELRDILYGESDNISVAGGPSGTATTNPQQEHLGKDDKTVALRFRHITTAVRFSQGIIPAGLTVTGITLAGVFTKGDFIPGNVDTATGTTGSWANQTSPGSYSVTTAFAGTNGVVGEDVYIDGGQVLFMIPQALPDDATLSVTLMETAKSKAHTITCRLNGDVWKKGYTVNYKLTVGELEEGYYLAADAVAEIEHSNTPVSGSLAVHSYHLYTDYSSGQGIDAYRAVKWVVDGYSTDGGATWGVKPSWLTDFRGVLDGTEYVGGNPATATFTLAKQELERSAAHDVVLYDNPSIGTTVSLNDHKPDGTSKSPETANCYIVNRSATTYSFPLVYGNKTVDGAEADCFKDHLGATISYRLIKDQMKAKNSSFAYEPIDEDHYQRAEYYWDAAATASDGSKFIRAVLLWQDVNGLVSQVNATSERISFTIGQSTPGNAVIALQIRKRIGYYTQAGDTYTLYTSQGSSGYGVADDWETLWTWHVWMTDEVYMNTGKSDDKYFDSFYVNGSGNDNTQADHIAQLKNAAGADVAKIMPVNLGWVPDDMSFGLYKPRSVMVRLKQTAGKGDERNTATVTITQHARQDLYTGTGTVYQWGRPTALPATRTITGTKRTIYDIDGNDITEQFEIALATSPGDAISKPFNGLRLESQANSWFDSSGADYASNAMWNSTTKTVYDPCPPGFRVPPASIFYGFSKTGTTVESDGTKLNMYQDVADLNGVTQRNGAQSKGGYFYLQADETRRYGVDVGVVGGVVYMPATGEFMANKTVGDKIGATDRQANQTYGLYWTSDYFSGDNLGCGLWITPDYSATGGTKDKPVLGFFDKSGHKSANNYYNALRAIRPMKVE